ncbi:MAG: hypothetical protein JJU36_12370 [Phycisphaeraceae bacterium]|nr:hypothetical protein [Phycisphaeraceae bacterium]
MSEQKEDRLQSRAFTRRLGELVERIVAEEPDLAGDLSTANSAYGGAVSVAESEETSESDDLFMEPAPDAGDQAVATLEHAQGLAEQLKDELEQSSCDQTRETLDEEDAGSGSGSASKQAAVCEEGEPMRLAQDAPSDAADRGAPSTDDVDGQESSQSDIDEKLNELLNRAAATPQEVAEAMDEAAYPEETEVQSDKWAESTDDLVGQTRQALGQALGATTDSASRDDMPAGSFADADTFTEPDVPQHDFPQTKEKVRPDTSSGPALAQAGDDPEGEPSRTPTEKAMLDALRSAVLATSNRPRPVAASTKGDVEPTDGDNRLVGKPGAVEAPTPDFDGLEPVTIEKLDSELAEEADEELDLDGEFHSASDVLEEDEPAQPVAAPAHPEPRRSSSRAEAKPAVSVLEGNVGQKPSLLHAVLVWLAGVPWRELRTRAARNIRLTCAWLNRPVERAGDSLGKVVGYAALITLGNAALLMIWNLLR